MAYRIIFYRGLEEETNVDEIVAITPDDILEALRLWHGGKPDKWPLAKLRLGLVLATDDDAYGSFAETVEKSQSFAVSVINFESKVKKLFY